jgi:hypothetical protein
VYGECLECGEYVCVHTESVERITEATLGAKDYFILTSPKYLALWRTRRSQAFNEDQLFNHSLE